MTSNNLKNLEVPIGTLQVGGVRVRAPLVLYEPRQYHLVIAALYGTPQQTRAVLAHWAMHGVVVATPPGQEIGREIRRPVNLRAKGHTIGPDVHRLLIWEEHLADTAVIWTDPAERRTRLRQALARRVIPFDPEWLDEIESLLVSDKQLLPLRGWGGQGYAADWEDQRACWLLLERYGRRRPSLRSA